MKQKYQCEVCDVNYDTPEKAIKCESQPKIMDGTEIAWDRTVPGEGHTIQIGKLIDVEMTKHSIDRAKIQFGDDVANSGPNLRFIPAYVELAKLMRFVGLDKIPNVNMPELKK